MTIRFGLFAALIALGGCASEANHVGNPLLLPSAAIASGIDNARYDARRTKLKRYVAGNRALILADISTGGGTHLNRAMHLADVPSDAQGKLRTELRDNPGIYAQADIEPLVVALMVHGD